MANSSGFRAKLIGISRWGQSHGDAMIWALRLHFLRTYEAIQKGTALSAHRSEPAGIRNIPYLPVPPLHSSCLPTPQPKKSCRPIWSEKGNSFRLLELTQGHAKRTL